MADRDPMSERDRWVLTILGVVSVALVVGAVVSGEATTYLGYLAGTATLGFLYVVLGD